MSEINNVTTRFVGNHYEVTGSTVTKYYYAGASRIAMRKYTIPQNMEVEYFLGDHLGSTSITTDSDGDKVSEIRYKAWGEIRYSWTSNPTTTPAYELAKYTFTGQYSYMDDPSTTSVIEGFGLMFYEARWYDAALGRFAQADSIIPGAGSSQAWDRYAYANNNPLYYTDPSGHWVCEDLDCDGPPSNGNGGSGGGGGSDTVKILNSNDQISEIISQLDSTFPWNELSPEIRNLLVKLGFGPIAWWEYTNGNAADISGTLEDPAVYISVALSGGATGLFPSFYEATLYTCLKSPICAYLIGAQELAKLPKRIGNKGSTSGTLYAGGRQTSVVSGWGGPGSLMPPGARGFNIVTRTHTEGQAAALMHQNGWQTGTLVINNTPCTSCELLLPRMLPPSSTLYLVGPDGYRSIFQGLP